MKIVFANSVTNVVIAEYTHLQDPELDPELIQKIIKFIQKEVGSGNKSNPDKLGDRTEHDNRKRAGRKSV